MSCDKCGRSGTKLIECLESDWTRYTKSRLVSDLERRSLLCGQCLLGKSIPVYRPSLSKFQIGSVQGFNWQTKEHRVLFDANDEETLVVSSTPFADCARSHQPTCKDTTKEEDKDDEVPPIVDAVQGAGALLSPGRPGVDDEDGGLIFRNGQFSFVKSEDDSASFDPTHEKTGFENIFGDTPVADPHDDSEMQQSTTAKDSPSGQLSEPDKTGDSFCSSMTGGKPYFPHTESPHGYSPKVSPRHWSSEEDQTLLDSINAFGLKELKWAVLAQAVAGRTGKQCRERYLNHLQPNLKGQDMGWLPAEDALICHLYNAIGSKWSMIAKLVRGRSENAVKNRYHYIRRKLDKLLQLTPKGYTDPSRDEPSAVAAKASNATEKMALLSAAVDAILRARSNPQAVDVSSYDWNYDFEFTFGPGVSSSDPSDTAETTCRRCALIVPSPQTGRSLCQISRWCESCATAPPFLSGAHLWMLHSARRESRFSSCTGSYAS
ncbi:Myb-related protein A [Seminavis robusta]|uniref:Myb-related protein A n=1 Tax=Seminavis robusta TaxID=568900 RepID=A0A9N8H5V6_9STRA|nr:Myb-related protein A [Seminavis robusta]|eukprot:Sro84_g044630.1 Myb-related protein A (490) ;mRNA; f:9550-11099